MKRIACSSGLSALVILGAALAGPAATAAQTLDEEISLAVLPLPEGDRADAEVLGHRDGRMTTIRPGEGAFVCLADAPDQDGYHAACYHRSLAKYMARGRELKAGGLAGRESIEKRWEEIESGDLEMPRHPVMLYQLFATDGADPTDPEQVQSLTVMYVSYRTVEETGLPDSPAGGLPWLMFPGSPTAHVMISG